MSAIESQVVATRTPQSRARWSALGTGAELLVTGGDQQLVAARAAVERWLHAVDGACSRFCADSDLSRLNGADGEEVPVSPLLIEATQVALRAARVTGGDVDPTLGVALELAGYDRDWAAIERQPELGPAPLVHLRPRAAWTGVRVDAVRGTIRLPRGVKLDLGATAKAWAADRAAGAARQASGCGVLVSLGGDLATAGPCPPGGWTVHVTDDHRDGPDAPGQTIAIRGGAIATSSTAVRRWWRGDKPMHHIIDPATGLSARTPWRTVSVAAADCTDANIAATAAIVRGERAVGWLARAGLPARLVAWDDEVVTVGDWPKQGTSA